MHVGLICIALCPSVHPSVCLVSLDQNSRPGNLKQLACFQALDQKFCLLNKHAEVIARGEMHRLMRSEPLYVLGSVSVYSESQLQSVDGSSVSASYHFASIWNDKFVSLQVASLQSLGRWAHLNTSTSSCIFLVCPVSSVTQQCDNRYICGSTLLSVLEALVTLCGQLHGLEKTQNALYQSQGKSVADTL